MVSNLPAPVAEINNAPGRPVAITQPTTPLDGALMMAARGVPQIRLAKEDKKPIDAGWPSTKTTDATFLSKHSGNFGSVACAEIGGFWFYEIDSKDVYDRIKKDTGNDLHQILTFKVRSRAGRGSFYFKQTLASIAMGNISQSYIKHEDSSVRVHNQYMVSCGSIHPLTKDAYTIACDADIVEAPQWLIDWLISQKETNKLKDTAKRNEHGKVQHGSINGWLCHVAGKMRNAGLEASELEAALLRRAHEECEEPLDDEKIRQVADSASKWDVGAAPLILNQHAIQQIREELLEAPKITPVEFPKFPDWILEGTSLYEGYVKPYCNDNSRIPYFMWYPTMQLYLNYLGLKVSIKGKLLIPSLYSILIGQRGQTKKSSCMNEAVGYLEMMGLATHANHDIKSADGRSLVWTAGSPEGLGLDMQRTNCKNAVLQYDELSILQKKKSIESSTLGQSLLLLYESGKFANAVKHAKEKYGFAPSSYTFSLMAANTLKSFPETWALLAGDNDGLEDRFTFILQPEKLPDRKLHKPIDKKVIGLAAMETRKLIDKALQQGEYEIEDDIPLQDALIWMTDREELRAEKYALYFAIDLGLDVIDLDCVERAIKLVEYEKAVKKYLGTSTAKTKIAAVQLKVRWILERQKDGRMSKRDLEREVRADEWGSDWVNIYGGLLRMGVIREEGAGTKGNPRMTQLMQIMDTEED